MKTKIQITKSCSCQLLMSIKRGNITLANNFLNLNTYPNSTDINTLLAFNEPDGTGQANIPDVNVALAIVKPKGTDGQTGLVAVDVTPAFGVPVQAVPEMKVIPPTNPRG